MLDGIFYQRLKDHAWNADVFDVFIYFPDIYNISGKAHIQDVDIIIYRLDLLPEHRIFFHLAHIIPEKIRHFFQKNASPLCIIQGIEQKMRIDLRLKELQLCFLKVCLHHKLSFLHLRLSLHAFLELVDVLADALQHLVKTSRHDSNFIIHNNRKLRNIEISFCNLMCRIGKSGQRADHIPHQKDRHCKPNHIDDDQYDQAESVQHIHR